MHYSVRWHLNKYHEEETWIITINLMWFLFNFEPIISSRSSQIESDVAFFWLKFMLFQPIRKLLFSTSHAKNLPCNCHLDSVFTEFLWKVCFSRLIPEDLKSLPKKQLKSWYWRTVCFANLRVIHARRTNQIKLLLILTVKMGIWRFWNAEKLFPFVSCDF